MVDKPTTAAGYTGEHVALVRSTCLYVATKLGDLMDELVVVGGLVPSLLVDEKELGPETQAHAGTMDLDVGLTAALLGQGRYRALTDRLRRAGFSQDVNEEGKPTRQRWTIGRTRSVAIDFLIPPTLPGDIGGKLRDIEPDFSNHDGIGPRRVAEFLVNVPDDTIQADVVGFVGELLRVLRG